MDEGQPVDQNGHIVAGLVRAGCLGILIGDLQAVVVDLFFVDEQDVLGGTVVALEHLDVVGLDEARLVGDVCIGIGNAGGVQALPFAIAERIVVEAGQLGAQVVHQGGFVAQGDAFVALFAQLA